MFTRLEILFQEVEADRKAAEESGCSVTLRSNNAGVLDQGKTNEV